MEDFNLYVILDRELLHNKDLISVAKELIDSGINLIQYRDKISSQKEILQNAKRIRELNFPLIINDYPQIAKEVDAMGVHIGQDDMDILKAREIIGKDKIVGRSTHNLKQALQAQKDGSDYIGIGPIFSTSTKKEAVPIGLDILKGIVKTIKIPVFAIGGITLYNINSVLDTGINRVAVASAIICSNKISETVKEFYRRLTYEPIRN